MEVREGDVIRLKPMTVSCVDADGDFYVTDGYTYDGRTWFEPDMVEEIISRIETPEETKERLESEVSFWKASAEAYNAEVIRLQNLLGETSDGQK
jgi:hypothetical protein